MLALAHTFGWRFPPWIQWALDGPVWFQKQNSHACALLELQTELQPSFAQFHEKKEIWKTRRRGAVTAIGALMWVDPPDLPRYCLAPPRRRNLDLSLPPNLFTTCRTWKSATLSSNSSFQKSLSLDVALRPTPGVGEHAQMPCVCESVAL